MTAPASRAAQGWQTSATSYQQAQQRNADATAATAVTLLSSLSRPDLPSHFLPAGLSGAIAGGASRAVTLADLGVSSYLSLQVAQPVPPVGLSLPEDTQAVISSGVDTVLAEHPAEELEAAVRRLARAASLEAGVRAYQRASAEQGVTGWVRATDDEPCGLCRALADGLVIPIDRTMISHPGCNCTPEPVLTGAAPHERPEEGPGDPATFRPTTLPTRTRATTRHHRLGITTTTATRVRSPQLRRAR